MTVIDSEFRSYERDLPLVEDYTRKVKVKVYKEKKSDVNLATHMIIDAVKNKYDIAVIATNDIDFVEPIKLTRYKFRKPVYLVPTVKYEKEMGKIKKQSFVAKELLRYSTNKRFVTTEMLANAQLPSKLKDDKGEIHKPNEWNAVHTKS